MSKSGDTWVKDLSLAASALGALSLLPARADAAVVKGLGGPIAFPVLSSNPVNWDINGDGTDDFRLSGYTKIIGNIAINQGRLYSLFSGTYNGNGLVGGDYSPVPPRLKATPLNNGFVVGPTLSLPNRWGQLTWNVSSSGAPGSNFPDFSDTANNYFGFRFQGGTDTFYGYARLDYTTPTATIQEWYWNNTPNGIVTVGQGADPVSSVPAPIGLAGLAAGAAWTRRLRRRIRESAEAA